jgi:hypothetical protein
MPGPGGRFPYDRLCRQNHQGVDLLGRSSHGGEDRRGGILERKKVEEERDRDLNPEGGADLSAPP